jgi:Ala-tRNA(Pro) deacylase
MPLFGNLYGLPVSAERSLTTQEAIVFPIGTHTETMSLKYADVERLIHPTILNFALKPSPFRRLFCPDGEKRQQEGAMM